MKKTIMMVVLLQMATGAMSAGKNTALSDDFSDAKKSGLNWLLSKKNVLIKDGKLDFNSGGTAKLKTAVPDNFTLSFDIATTKPAAGNKTLGFCGVDINGIKFLIRTDGLYWGIYRLPGEKSSRGNAGKIAGFAFGKADTMTITSQKAGDGFKYTCKVNDKQIISFTFPGTAKRKIVLMAYKISASFDNFKFKPES
jgi:hypothetical protein